MLSEIFSGSLSFVGETLFGDETVNTTLSRSSSLVDLESDPFIPRYEIYKTRVGTTRSEIRTSYPIFTFRWLAVHGLAVPTVFSVGAITSLLFY